MSSSRLSTLTVRRGIQASRPSHSWAWMQTRAIHRTSTLTYPRKDSQDKDSINTEATEYSKSGTDDEAARNDQAAFDPSTTQPGQERDQAGKGNGSNPLDVSPANPEVSKQRPLQEGGAENSAGSKDKSDRKQASGHGSPPKGKKVN
ncbi:MAG: hypothetical protein M1818_006079 [Claussenomyces sp. TS43310]|nr:MAG: hypothetical protein M1818_006079 [Claussenomyces sp. TS43310]